MKFSYNKMDTCCSEMQIVINRIKEILDNIIQIQNQLSKNEYWKGEAATFYFNKMKQLTSNFDGINMELENSLNYLRCTMESYVSIDRNIVAGVKNILNKGV